MVDKTKLTPGTLSLSEIEREIKFEEAKSFEFLTSKVENNKDNLTSFKKLVIGNIPNELKLTLSVNSAPEGYVPFPNNPLSMIVNSSTEPINIWVWRQQ